MNQLESPLSNHLPMEHHTQAMELEFQNWESFKCPSHPHFKVDALCIDENSYDEPKLLCIKCIIEEDYFSSPGGKKLITVKDLMQKCSDLAKAVPETEMEKPNSGIEEKFLGFIASDHAGEYERHLKSQYQVVNDEITKLIDELTELKEKYKDFYNSELEDASRKSTDIKKKIKKYLDENLQSDRSQVSPASHIANQYNSIQGTDDFCKFLKGIYSKSKEISEQTTHIDNYDETLQAIEEFKIKASTMEEKTADIAYLREMSNNVNKVLRSGNLIFKSRHGLRTLFNSKSLPENFPMKIEHSSVYNNNNNTSNMNYNANSQWSTYSAKPSIVKSSPFSEQVITSFEPYRTENIPMSSSLAMDRKKRKIRFSDIDSQALRNMKKEIEEKENASPGDLKDTAKDTAVNKLLDWINRRITGYLLFQNTVSHDPRNLKEKEQYSELGVHLNHLIGQKWKALSAEEKDEYRLLAKKYRKDFKKDIEIYHETEDLTDLIESLDLKIKKLKKE